MRYPPQYVAFRNLLALCLSCLAIHVTLRAKAQAEPTSASSSVGLCSSDLRDSVIHDLADGSLDSLDLVSAAILLGGEIEIEQLNECRNRMFDLQSQLSRQIRPHDSHRQVTKLVLRAMHDRILTGPYEPGCCSLHDTIQGGPHNCVMSTILFQSLARLLGLDVKPLALPQHVRCRIIEGQSSFDVETTSSDGTDVSRSPTDSSRVLSDCELLAKVLYNRGLQDLKAGNYSAALDSTELSYQLDPRHQSAEENVVAIINNWALQLCGEEKFREAIELFDRNATDSHKLHRWNRRHVMSRWLEHARISGDLATVIQLDPMQDHHASNRADIDMPSRDN